MLLLLVAIVVVSYANLPEFGGNVLLEKLDSAGDHVEAATTCLLQSILYMLSDDFVGAQVTEKSTDLGCPAITVNVAEPAPLEDSFAPSAASNAPSAFETMAPTVSPAPTETPRPTVTPRPTGAPTRENMCGEVLVSWNAEEARNVITEVYADTYGENSQEFLLYELFADQSFKYGVQVRKVCGKCGEFSVSSSSYDEYCGQNVYGAGATQSGLLMLPMSSDGMEIAGGTFPGFVYNHDATVDRAPSNEWSGVGGSMASGVMFGVLPAAAGSVAIIPDYLGYGESNAAISKAFFVKKSYQTSIVPLWLKAASILEEETNCTALADAAMISGFSEGGYASIPVADALSNLGIDIIRVQAGAVPARLGSIHLPETVRSIDDTTFPLNERSILALFGSAYSATYTGMANFEEGPYLLETSIRDEIVNLVTEGASASSLEAAVPADDPLSIWNSDVVTWSRVAYLLNDTDPCGQRNFTTVEFRPFCDALVENDLTDLLESSSSYPITLCHGRDDNVVSVKNLPNATANNNLLISLVDGNHAASYVTCTSQIISFLSSPSYSDYPIVPKHDESVCVVATESPASTPASTPTPSPDSVSSLTKDNSASCRTATTILVSIIGGLLSFAAVLL